MHHKPLLLLEDDPAIAQTVAYALSREGFVIEHVALVSQARDRLVAGAPGYAAAILDVGLPDGSGMDLCRDLRQMGGPLAALPIMMLTARSEEIDRVLGLELGADDYLSKPFSTRELCARLRALLRRAGLPALQAAGGVAASARHSPHSVAASGHQANGLFAHGHAIASPASSAADDHTKLATTRLFHDSEGQRIRYGETWLALTRRELGLLQVLLKAPGRIWPRDALLDAVWGQDADSTDRTVDTHIKTLRAKLREAGAHADLIVTHRGLGYALDPRLL
jgi:two-component system catabolic regulation response regulator CreB